MNLNQLITDLEEIKSAINEDPERAEDLLGFVIGEITIAAQQNAQATEYITCPKCNGRGGLEGYGNRWNYCCDCHGCGEVVARR